MQERKYQGREGRRAVSVGWKLFAYLMVFVLFILAVIWFFQIHLLDYFYRNTKYKELETISGIVAEYVDTDSLEEAVDSCAAEYAMCIRVFRKTELVANEVANADVVSECVIHQLSQAELNNFYQKAKEGGGVYAATKEMRSHHDIFFDRWNPDKLYVDRISLGMVYNTVIPGADGAEYMIMLGAELTPVDATVNTLKTQFIWIVSVLTVAAFLLAFLISRNISGPISKMNRSAKKLAEGRYDVTFDGRGYREIRELADSLNYASEELSRSDRLQRELIANVSHDLRTPLTMIKGYSEVMRDIPGENTPENLQVVIDETTRLSELVSDMLDLSRIRAGTRQPQPTRFCLTDAVREVLGRYDKLIHMDGYRIDFSAQADVYVVADRVMVLQVLYNLINNAIHYVGEDKCVVVEQMVEEGKVRIAVTDHGVGIEPEQLDRIWDRYYKVDRVHKRAAVGTGLGLSIVKGILESHRAAYGVKSAPGRGSSFWFALPISVESDGADMIKSEEIE